MPPASKVNGDLTEKHLRQACADLDRQLRAGLPAGAEQYFASHPSLAAREDYAVELIYTEFVTREELGRRPTAEEFYTRFPFWKAALQRQFQIHDLLRDSLQGEEITPAPFGPGMNGAPTGGRRWLGQYELLEEIARGGCGVVHRALQHGLQRTVAVKVLLPEYSRLMRARQRFCHEARVMATLRHPHIMPIHDISESDGVIFFSMDYVPTGSLADRLARGGRRPRDFAAGRPPDERHLRADLELLEAVARAVDYAHSQGVVHCDLKPSNGLLDEQRGPLVSDFGLAKLPSGEADQDAQEEIVGTPAYMAPEQVEGHSRPLTPAIDVWALGVILYEILTGRRPFEGNALSILRQLLTFTGPVRLPPPQSALEERLHAVCTACLCREPAKRYGSAAELAGQLQLALSSA